MNTTVDVEKTEREGKGIDTPKLNARKEVNEALVVTKPKLPDSKKPNPSKAEKPADDSYWLG